MSGVSRKVGESRVSERSKNGVGTSKEILGREKISGKKKYMGKKIEREQEEGGSSIGEFIPITPIILS